MSSSNIDYSEPSQIVALLSEKLNGSAADADELIRLWDNLSKLLTAKRIGESGQALAIKECLLRCGELFPRMSAYALSEGQVALLIRLGMRMRILFRQFGLMHELKLLERSALELAEAKLGVWHFQTLACKSNLALTLYACKEFRRRRSCRANSATIAKGLKRKIPMSNRSRYML